MAHNSTTNEDTTDQSEETSLEERIAALEEQNEKLANENAQIKTQNEQIKTQLDQQQDGGLPNVTRRQALGGLLGGGALLGAAGSASAQSGGNGGDDSPFGDDFPFGDDDDSSSDGGNPPWAPDDHDHSGDYLGKGKRVDQIDAARVNGIHHLDPEAEDWGAAVNAALEEMDDGDVLKVPPVQYRTKTKAVINKDISLVGDASGYPADQSEPVIVKDADIPVLEAQDASESKYGRAVQPSVIGLRFKSAVDDTTPGAIFHGTVELKRIYGEKLGGHVILLQQRAGIADNMNNCLVQDVSGSRCDGSVVRIENISGAGNNVNAQRISVRNAFRNNGWGIDADAGFGNYYSVQVLHGSEQEGERSGGIRMNTTRSMGRLIYVEGDVNTGIQFGKSNNTGEIIKGVEVLEGSEFVDKTGRNRHINYGKVTAPDITKPEIPYILSGGLSIRNGNAEVADPENGLVLTAPNGVQYQFTVDVDGNLVTERIARDYYEIPNQSLTINADVSELSNLDGLSLTDDFTVRKDPTASGTVWVTWDQSYLYLAADIQDDEHKVKGTGNAAIYDGDVLELAIAPPAANSYIQIDASLTPQGPEVYKSEWPGRAFIGQIDVPVEITRNGDTNHTMYEVAVPWGELPVDHTDNVMKMALGYRDVDTNSSGGPVRTGQFEWADGLIAGKDPSGLNPIELVEE